MKLRDISAAHYPRMPEGWQHLAARLAAHADSRDRRAWLLRLAERGDALLGKALPAHYAWVANLMRHFSAEERQLLKHLMGRLHQAGVTQ